MAGLPVRASKQAGAVRAAGVPPRAPSGRPPPPDEPAAGPSGNGAGLGGWSRRSSLDGVDSLLQVRTGSSALTLGIPRAGYRQVAELGRWLLRGFARWGPGSGWALPPPERDERALTRRAVIG